MPEHVRPQRTDPHDEARLVQGQHEPAAGAGRDQRETRSEQQERREDDDLAEQPQ